MADGLAVLSVCTGVGGLDLGLERAGHRIIAQCEIDERCRAILAKHWPDVPLYEDLLTMPRGAWNRGKTYTMAVREVYANKGSWNLAMRRMFAAECMRCGWADGPCDTHHIVPKRDGGPMSLANGIILCPNCHRLADVGILSQSELAVIRARALIIGERVGEVVPSEAPQTVDLLCGGFPQRAKTSASQGDVRDSTGSAAGSSTPSPTQLTLGYDQEAGSFLRTYSDYFPALAELEADETSRSYSRRWPTSGFTTSPGECWTADTSECPSDGDASTSLADVLLENVPERFYLSPRAAAGILRRAAKRGRELPPQLHEALTDLASQHQADDKRTTSTSSQPSTVKEEEPTTTTPRPGISSQEPSSSDTRRAPTATQRTLSSRGASDPTSGPDRTPAPTSSVRRLTPTECERLQGFPDQWTIPK